MPPSGITSTYPVSPAEWLMMATSKSMGVSSHAGVTRNSALTAALIKPVWSATPTPSMATSTTPNGGNSVKFLTSRVRKVARAGPES